MTSEPVRIGIIGAGNRGSVHAAKYRKIPCAHVVAVADIDRKRAAAIATNHEECAVFEDYRNLLQHDLDAVDVCVHNNLHAPMTIDALRAGLDVFCEKPMAASYTDAKRMYDVSEETGCRIAVQNRLLYTKETEAASRLIDEGRLGYLYYARAGSSKADLADVETGNLRKAELGARRRPRPFLDGYGTPQFVQSDASGGGAIYDLGTYTIGRMLYLFNFPEVQRVRGRTHRYLEDVYREKHVSDHAETYHDRLTVAEYDVEDVGVGFLDLGEDRSLSLRTAWSMYLDDTDSSSIVGSEGGIQFEPFRFHTTMEDMEATTSFDLDGYQKVKHDLADETAAYEDNLWTWHQYHWIRTLRGLEEPIPTAKLGLESMIAMEGLYLSAELGREVTREEIIENSESTATDLS